ncbi:MAG: glycosyltransferase [Flavobacteriaceae bacterium]|nr:MAG: glycosyltransferase [Flavobacteriaceae bacterium]
MKKITTIIPTLNEEERVGNALKSVEFADEIIVIDSFSTDRTLAIVKETKAILLQRKFDDFSSQKNYAIHHASHDWILWLDADEVISDDLRKEVITTLKDPKDFAGFYIYRTFFFMKKALRFSGTQNDKLIRLFNKKYCRYEGVVHEKIKTDRKLGVLNHRILHYSYIGFNRYIEKLELHSKLRSEELYKKGLLLTPYHFIIKPLARFIKHYFIKLGFLDGFQGLVLSYALSYGVLVRYTHLWKLKYMKIKNTETE